MPLPLRASVRLAVAVCSVFLAGATWAQNAFSPGGPDYSVLGPLGGDQTAPQAAVEVSGGWMVWQDNAADGNGLGVRAVRLDGQFQAVGAPFRVNAQGVGEQEKPQVALLPGGGAVIVWQGGAPGFQQIFARFYNVYGQPQTTNDIVINSVTNGNQVTPAVAVNAAGDVLVVWAGYEVKLPSDSSPDPVYGVYGQRLNAAGQKQGDQFRINLVTLNGQRSPAVAALTDGRFVVGWISELQRAINSVDVYFRFVSAAGVPTGSHVAVNTSTINACANPSLAGAPDGGFLVAWSQSGNIIRGQTGDVQITDPTPNGWDVFYRHYNASGVATADPKQLNTFSYGDQFAPKIAAFGRNFLATWVSLGQDSSREGVYGQFFSATGGALEGPEFRINTTTASRQIHPSIATDGVNRFIVNWTSFHAGSSFDVRARVYDIIRMQTTVEGGNLRLTWNSVPGCVYQVQVSTNFGQWQNVGGELPAVSTSMTTLVAPQANSAIFRVVRVR